MAEESWKVEKVADPDLHCNNSTKLHRYLFLLQVQESSNDTKDKKKNGSKSPEKSYSDDYCQDYGQDYDQDYSVWSGEGYDYSEPVYEGLSKEEQMVIDKTGCEDLQLIRYQLEAHEYDVDEAIDSTLNYVILQQRGVCCSLGLWSVLWLSFMPPFFFNLFIDIDVILLITTVNIIILSPELFLCALLLLTSIFMCC